MKGSIIGDIVGSRFEFRNNRTKQFDLFSPHCFFTDDTVLTVATMYALLENRTKSEEISAIYQEFCRKYPHRGYGGRFRLWIDSNDPKPYNSFGNGSAMRTSPIGFAARTEEDVVRLATQFASVTHDHEEGVKGAVVTSMCIFLARNFKNKERIREYAQQYYDIDFNYDDLKITNRFDETCQGSVPQAIYCFLISNSYEDCIRTAVSIGGDSDTIACIAGGIAEAYYGTEEIDLYYNAAQHFLTKELKQIVNKFYETYRN